MSRLALLAGSAALSADQARADWRAWLGRDSKAEDTLVLGLSLEMALLIGVVIFIGAMAVLDPRAFLRGLLGEVSLWLVYLVILLVAGLIVFVVVAIQSGSVLIGLVAVAMVTIAFLVITLFSGGT